MEENKKQTVSKEEMVNIPKSVWDQMVRDVSNLKEVSSRQRLQEAEERNKSKFKYRTAHIKRHEGKTVKEWLAVKNPNFKGSMKLITQGNNILSEDIRCHYVTLSGEEIVCPMVEFVRSNDYVKIEILEEFDAKDKDGKIVMENMGKDVPPQPLRVCHVRFFGGILPEGEPENTPIEFNIVKKFINP